MIMAKAMSDLSSCLSASGVPVTKAGLVRVSMNSKQKASLSWTQGISMYMLKISPSSKPSDSTMYW